MVLSWVFLFTSYSNAQDIYTTGNIVVPTTTSSGSTWTNAVYQNSLTCWAYGDPGYCGPNAIVRPGDNINFSYGSTYIYQQQNVASLLPNTGTGLQVNGYNFSFIAKNGNGWDDGRVDNLTALVRFWDNTGGRSSSNLLYGNAYNLNYKFNWTAFNYSETFTSPLAVPNIGQVQYGFIGSDNNFWAGPYGPEIYGVKFSLKYSVDPCSTNPMYSATCPGYLEALAKLVPTAVSSPTTTIVDYSLPLPPPPPPPPPSTVESGVLLQQPPPPPTPPPSTQQAGNPPPPGSQPLAQQSQPGAAPAPVAVQSSSSQEKSGTPGNLNAALSLIAKNSEKEKAIVQQTLATASAEAQSATDKTQQLALSVSGSAVANSMSSSATIVSGSGIQASTNSTRLFNLVGNTSTQQSVVSLLQPNQTYSSQSTVLQQASQIQLVAPTVIETVTIAPVNILYQPVQKQQETEIPQQSTNFLSDRNNPIREIVESQHFQPSAQEQKTSNTVKKDVVPNDLAIGTSLDRMATQPVGYANYMNFALKDASFYVPKDIYPKQNTVDNVRALRQLSSDRLHQEMVQQQYK